MMGRRCPVFLLTTESPLMNHNQYPFRQSSVWQPALFNHRWSVLAACLVFGLVLLVSGLNSPRTSILSAEENNHPQQDGTSPEDTAKPGKLYELRIYVTHPGKLPDLHQRFRNHTCGLFEKHGMENIIYWDVVEGDKSDGTRAENMMVYVIAHKDEAAREASWKAFIGDPEWQAVAKKSEEQGKILAEPPIAILMRDVEFSPADEPANQQQDSVPRLFELRHYNDGPARVPFTVDRFGSGEVELFQESGMQTLKFWRTTDDKAFIYLLAHTDRESSKESWKTFMGGFRDFMSKYNASGKAPPADAPRGQGMEVRFLKPTDYSPRK